MATHLVAVRTGRPQESSCIERARTTYQRWTMSLAAMPRLFAAAGLAPARMSSRATSMLLVYLREGVRHHAQVAAARQLARDADRHTDTLARAHSHCAVERRPPHAVR